MSWHFSTTLRPGHYVASMDRCPHVVCEDCDEDAYVAWLHLGKPKHADLRAYLLRLGYVKGDAEWLG